MKLLNILVMSIVISCFSITVAFALPGVSNASNINKQQQKDDCIKKDKRGCEKNKCGPDAKKELDPIKVLQSKKEKVQALLKDGKIPKEKADAIISRIDSKIKEIKEFNRLTLQQKRETLINDCKAFVKERVKEGKITQERADEIVKIFTEKIEKWDGKGYPQFHGKGFIMHMHNNKNNNQ